MRRLSTSQQTVRLLSLVLLVPTSLTGWASGGASLAGDELAGKTVLLDFYAPWCGPCQQMAPVIEQLRRAGYPVRKINVESEPALAKRFRITAVPTFVMLVNGREMQRIVGPATLDQLLMLCRLAPQRPPDTGTAPASPPASPPPSPPRESSQLAAQRESPVGFTGLARTLPPFDSRCRYAGPTEADLIAATVRIRIEDSRGRSTGSGTIIDARGGEALIVTCGHLFRESGGQAPILVDLFGPEPVQNLKGQLIYYDDKLDIGFVSIRVDRPVVVARVAPPGYPLGVGDPVFSVGCGEGQPPQVWEGRITALDKYLGPGNIEASRAPVVGRSGGGLFSGEGFLIGVCNAADPPLNEGIYLALREIHRCLDRLNLAVVYRTDTPSIATTSPGPGSAPRTNSDLSQAGSSNLVQAGSSPAVEHPTPRLPVAPGPAEDDIPSVGRSSPEALTLAAGFPLPVPTVEPPERARNIGQVSWGGDRHIERPSPEQVAEAGRDSADVVSRLTPEEQAAWAELVRRQRQGYEIVCVVRPLDRPDAPSEVFVLREMSPEFLTILRQSGVPTPRPTAESRSEHLAVGTSQAGSAKPSETGTPLVPVAAMTSRTNGAARPEVTAGVSGPRSTEPVRPTSGSIPLPAAVMALPPPGGP